MQNLKLFPDTAHIINFFHLIPFLAIARAVLYPMPLFAPVIMKASLDTSNSRSAGWKFFDADLKPLLEEQENKETEN